MSDEDTAARVARLEAWVEVVMRSLATLGLEELLTELDEARGADYSDVCLPSAEDPRATGYPPYRHPRGMTQAGAPPAWARRPAPYLWCRASPCSGKGRVGASVSGPLPITLHRI